MPRKPFNLLDRDVAILNHLVRYRLGLLTTISKAVFNGGEPGRPLSFLAREGFIERHTRSLENNVTYFTPTAEAYRAIGVKVNGRATAPMSEPAMDNATAIACGCQLGEFKRHRITREELVEITGNEADTPPNNIFHVLSEEVGWPIVLRVVFANSVGPRVLEKLKKHVREAKRNTTLGPWIAGGDYGFLVLVPWPEKLADLRSLIAGSALATEYIIVLDVGPITKTLAAFLKKRRGDSDAE